MNIVMAYLKQNPGILEPYGVQGPLSFLHLTPRFKASNHIVSLILQNGSTQPVLVAKVARLSGPSASLERESANLKAIEAGPAAGFANTPRLVVFDRTAGHHLLIETAVPGKPVDPRQVRKYFRERVEKVTGWLADFHYATRIPAALRPGWFDRLVRPLPWIEPPTAEKRFAYSQTLTTQLAEMNLPLVFEHGDLSHPNLLLDGDSLGVIDWEQAEPSGLPACDLFFFLAYAGFAKHKARSERQYLDAFRGAFFGEDAWALPYIQGYKDRLGLPEESLKPLFLLTWQRYLNALHERLAVPDQPIEADQETARWLKNNRYYQLWQYANANLDGLRFDKTRAFPSAGIERYEESMFTVAIVGPDGAGKTTISRKLLQCLPVPVKYLYMGINSESSNKMLPTTRLAARIKRLEGGTVAEVSGEKRGSKNPIKRVGKAVRSGFVLINRLGEEWFRQGLVWYYLRRGNLVLFDRHFFLDYYAYDIRPTAEPRPWNRKIHGWMLNRVYPKPDLVIYLNAPAEVLFARKGEGTLESLERRRQEYMNFERLVPNFAVVDATQPEDRVLEDVSRIILEFFQGRKRRLNRA